MSDITEQGPVGGIVAICVMVPVADVLTRVRLFYARSFQAEEDIQSNRYEGDDTSQTQDELLAARGTILCDKWDYDAIQTIFSKTKVTGGLGAGVDWGMYMQDDAEVAGVRPVGVEVYQKFKDESVSPNELAYMRRYYPFGTMNVMRTQGTAEWKAKYPMQLNFTAEKTTIDAVGDTLPGTPSSGAYYRWDRLSALPF
jgi:hypothetical protein